MNNLPILLALILIVGSIGGSLVIYWDFSFQTTKEDLLNFIRDEFGGEVSDLVYENNCLLCTEQGCTLLGQPCWKGNVTDEFNRTEVILTQEKEILKETTITAAAGGGGNSIPSDGPDGGLSPTECEYQYTQQQGSQTTSYTNTGCLNPNPTCTVQNTCVACVIESDCLGLIERRDQGEQITTELLILGTQYTGTYDHTSNNCIINDSVITIYDNTTDYSTCESILNSHIICDDGLCDFI